MCQCHSCPLSSDAPNAAQAAAQAAVQVGSRVGAWLLKAMFVGFKPRLEVEILAKSKLLEKEVVALAS